MKQLHQKIEARKRAIMSKKHHIERDYKAVKRTLTSNKSLSLVTLGGFIIGFLLLPRKLKLARTLFKAYTVAATLNQIADLVPHVSPDRKKRVHK